MEKKLLLSSNLIDPSSYTELSMEAKGNMLTTLDSLTQSMCKGFVPGESAGIANNVYVTLLTINKFTNDIDSASISLAAPNTFPANDVMLGSSLKAQYESYSCGSGETCTSVCVSSWEVSIMNPRL